MTTNTERDELARELFIADNGNQSREQSLVDWEWFESTDNYRGRIQHYKDMAAGMITAGYSKPRTITTVEELDALPLGSVILDGGGLSLHKNAFTGWCASNGAKDIEGELLLEATPATVLHVPEPTA